MRARRSAGDSLSARGPTASSARTEPVRNWCSGSWNTVPMRVSRSRERHRHGSVPRAPAIGAPGSTTGRRRVAAGPPSVSARVDLPAPFGPVMAVMRPESTRRSMPRCTGRSGNARDIEPMCGRCSGWMSRARRGIGRATGHPTAARRRPPEAAPPAPTSTSSGLPSAITPPSGRARRPGRRPAATPTRGAR